MIRDKLRRVLSDLNTPSDYPDDWYAWVVHHIAHTALGMLAARAFSDAWFSIAGEYPDKLSAWVIFSGMFVVYQITGQRDRERDRSNDILYFSFGLLLAFIGYSEVSAGQPVLQSNPVPFWLFFTLWVASFFPGIFRRIDRGGSDA